MAKKYRNKIGPKWKAGRDFALIRSPYDGQTVGQVALAPQAHAEEALEAAAEAFAQTRDMPAHARAQVCYNVAAGIQRRADELAELITAEAGKPIQYSRAEVARGVQTFLLAAEETKRWGGEVIPLDLAPATEGYVGLTRRFPRGIMAAITPFNFPLNLVAHKLAPALATGTPVVLKPARQTPITSLVLAEIIEQAGWPEGALSVLYCDDSVSEYLVTEERVATLSFTGSDRVGWVLKEKIPRKHVLLELGGDAAAIVAKDADLEWAIPRCAVGAFAYGGQICISIQRLLVAREIRDEFIERFVAHVNKLPVGDPIDPKTVIGPVIEEGAANRIEKWVEEACAQGAEKLAGGRREANLIWPVVLTNVPPDSQLACSEVFGPVVSIGTFDDLGEAFEKVNASRYGLQAGLFSRDLPSVFQAFNRLEVGGVVANDYPMLRVDNHPYGGVKDSGFGREGVRPAMEELTEVKTLLIKTT